MQAFADEQPWLELLMRSADEIRRECLHSYARFGHPMGCRHGWRAADSRTPRSDAPFASVSTSIVVIGLALTQTGDQ